MVDTAIWKFNSVSNTFASYKTGLTLIAAPTSSALLRSSNSLILWLKNANSLQVIVFNEFNGSLFTIYSVTHQSFDSSPSIVVSPLLTKVCVYGIVSSSLYIKYFHVDYANNAFKDITFPTDSIVDSNAFLILLEENWLYVRQLQNYGTKYEDVYSIQLNTLPVLANAYVISQNNWLKSIIKPSGANILQILSQVTDDTNLHRIVVTKL